MITEKDYCDYETCVALEELGFLIRRIKVKGTEKGVPILLSEAQKWLREEKNIITMPRFKELSALWDCIVYNENKQHAYGVGVQETYEEALLEGIKEVIKILKEAN